MTCILCLTYLALHFSKQIIHKYRLFRKLQMLICLLNVFKYNVQECSVLLKLKDAVVAT